MSAIDRLAPIELAELTELAGLQIRVDRKYLLRRGDLEQLTSRLPDDSQVLQIGDLRRFGYRSIYLDSAALDSYLAAARPRRRRFKVRLRSYLDTNLHVVEVKTRGPRGTTVKQRFDSAHGERLEPGQQAQVRSMLDAQGIPRAASLDLAPVLTTAYERTTLYLPADHGRVTIDSRLSWTLADGRRLAPSELVIVETKSANGAGAVDRLLWSAGHRPTGISKYGTGLAALRPELPANRWHRVLQRHFRSTDTNARTR